MANCILHDKTKEIWKMKFKKLKKYKKLKKGIDGCMSVNS